MNRTIIVCRCEEVSMKDIVNTAKTYQCSSREVKLRTRAGMGYCGGRICRSLVDQMTSRVTQEAPAHDIPLKYRSPVRPISFGELEGGYHDS